MRCPDCDEWLVGDCCARDASPADVEQTTERIVKIEGLCRCPECRSSAWSRRGVVECASRRLAWDYDGDYPPPMSLREMDAQVRSFVYVRSLAPDHPEFPRRTELVAKIRATWSDGIQPQDEAFLAGAAAASALASGRPAEDDVRPTSSDDELIEEYQLPRELVEKAPRSWHILRNYLRAVTNGTVAFDPDQFKRQVSGMGKEARANAKR